jgi:predicted DNA-binding protein YlxM (UPF0122 family)
MPNARMTTPFQQYQADAAKRKAKALRLYQRGKSFSEIGAAIGVTRARAHQIIKAAKEAAK